MKFMEAIKAMKEGKKVRRKCWTDEQYVYVSNDAVLWSNNTNPKFRVKQFEAIDWELYENEKHSSELSKELKFNNKIMDVLCRTEDIDKNTLFIIWDLWRIFLGEQNASCCGDVNKLYKKIQEMSL